MTLKRLIIENSHDAILERKEALGYSTPSEGGCFGIMSLGLLSILSRRVKLFDYRIIEICNTPVENIVNEVAAAQQKYKNGRELNDREQVMLNAHPFFYTMSLFINAAIAPNFFPDLSYTKAQNVIQTSALLLPVTLEEEGGLVVVEDFSGAYTYPEIIKLFKALRECLLAADIQHAMGFVLHSSNHTMVVGFDPECDKWIFIDANTLPVQLCTTNEIAYFLLNLRNFCVFSTEVIVTKKYEAASKHVMQNFKNSAVYKQFHNVTPERIKRVNGYDATWIHIAARQGNDQLVKEILDVYLKLYLDINIRCSDEHYSPIWQACQEGYANVVSLLLQYGAHPDGLASDGSNQYLTALGVATQNGHIDVVRLLIQAGADVNFIDSDQESLILKASARGHVAVIQELIASGAAVDIARSDGATALYFASQNGHVEAVRLLLQLGASPDTKATSAGGGNSTPLTIAIKNNHHEIVTLLMKYTKIVFTKQQSLIAAKCWHEVIVKHPSLNSMNITPLQDRMFYTLLADDIWKSCLYYRIFNNIQLTFTSKFASLQFAIYYAQLEKVLSSPEWPFATALIITPSGAVAQSLSENSAQYIYDPKSNWKTQYWGELPEDMLITYRHMLSTITTGVSANNTQINLYSLPQNLLLAILINARPELLNTERALAQIKWNNQRLLEMHGFFNRLSRKQALLKVNFEEDLATFGYREILLKGIKNDL